MMNVRDLLSLEGRVAIVTGGRGLYGASISEGLAEMGAIVFIASRNEEKCEEYAAVLREKGYTAYGAQLDLSDDASIDRLVDRVMRQCGKIDILVNNAVNSSMDNTMENLERKDLETTQDVNLNGQIVISKKVIEQMMKRGSGNIINMSSIRGIDAPHFPLYPKGMISGIGYTTEKWALVGATKWMAAYYGKHNIRVNCICPGGYNPALADHPERSAFVKTYEDNCPLGRWATDYDIKGPVVFLASDASGYVTGHTLVMDGGWTIW